VPILDRLTAGHLDDAALAEIWTAQTGASSEVIADSHLAQCAECRVRFAAFTAWMDDVRADGVAAADEAFPAERLAAQQAQIFRRLETAERPARVIAFPKYPVGAVGQPLRVHRWIAMAAAAGLLVGLGLGQLMDLRHLGEPEAMSVTAPANAPDTAATTLDYVSLIDEMEAAASAPRYEALRAVDSATPRAADYVTSSR
jgi:hypothetical protein